MLPPQRAGDFLRKSVATGGNGGSTMFYYSYYMVYVVEKHERNYVNFGLYMLIHANTMFDLVYENSESSKMVEFGDCHSDR